MRMNKEDRLVVIGIISWFVAGVILAILFPSPQVSGCSDDGKRVPLSLAIYVGISELFVFFYLSAYWERWKQWRQRRKNKKQSSDK